MALYRTHVGVALGLDGAVWCEFHLNAGLTQENLDARVAMLPGCETLRQGRKNVGDQFLYRFNTDERTVVAAVAQFHRGLWLTVFASTDPRIIGLFATPEFLGLPTLLRRLTNQAGPRSNLGDCLNATGLRAGPRSGRRPRRDARRLGSGVS